MPLQGVQVKGNVEDIHDHVLYLEKREFARFTLTNDQ